VYGRGTEHKPVVNQVQQVYGKGTEHQPVVVQPNNELVYGRGTELVWHKARHRHKLRLYEHRKLVI
jgi:hypothetical protein